MSVARAMMALMAALVAGCGAAGNQGLYEPSYGGGPPQCGIADARPPPPPTTPWNPPSGPTRGSSQTNVALEPWQQHARASQMIAQIAQVGANVGRMLEQARAQRDVVKTLCMNDKLSQIDVALRSAMDRKVSLGEAAGRGDVEVATHEFTVLTVLNQRVQQLAAESSQCVGEEIAFQAETVVTAQISAGRTDSVRRAPRKREVARDEAARRSPPPPAPPASRSTGDMMKSLPGVAAHGRSTAVHGGQAPAQPTPPPTPRPNVPSPGPATPAPPPKQAPASVLTADAPHDQSLMVYTADVGLAVPHVGKGLDSIETIARDTGGYLSQRTDREITILVPRERFIETLEKITKLGDVRRRVITALDVTDEFVDLEVRLTNARALRERLIVLRAEAKTVHDQLEVEKELGRIIGEIDRMESKLKLLSEKIAFSTITVSLDPVVEPMVCATTVLPFPWIQEIGLSSLLNVHP